MSAPTVENATYVEWRKTSSMVVRTVSLRLSTAQRLIARDWVSLYRQTFA